MFFLMRELKRKYFNKWQWPKTNIWKVVYWEHFTISYYFKQVIDSPVSTALCMLITCMDKVHLHIPMEFARFKIKDWWNFNTKITVLGEYCQKSTFITSCVQKGRLCTDNNVKWYHLHLQTHWNLIFPGYNQDHSETN